MNCLTVDGELFTVTQLPDGEQCTGYVLLTQTDLQQHLYEFDAATFDQILGWMLVSFVSGHVAGRICRLMRI